VSRIDRLPPHRLTAEQQALHAEIAHGPRADGPQLFALTDDEGGLRGPFNAFLLSPRVGRALQDVGAAIRYRSELTPRIREMAILAVAARWQSAFEWRSHEPIARSAGVTDEELDCLRDGKVLPLDDETESTALLAVRGMLDGDVADDVYGAVVTQIGEGALFELSTLVGYYATLALQMRVFRVTE
jgi:4-carboxymuconolactone decarboxylase